MVDINANAPYGINPKNGKPYTYWQAVFDESSDTYKAAQQDYWDTLKAAGKGIGAGTMDVADSMYGDDGKERFQWSWLFSNPSKFLGELGGNIGHWAVNTGHKGYGNEKQDPRDRYIERLKKEPLWQDKNGNFAPDDLTTTFLKLFMNEDDNKVDLQDPLLADFAAGAGKESAGVSGSKPLNLPSIGAMPKLPDVDWQGIRDRINNINVDANYEAPQRDPLVALGDFLANIDLTSNLSGDWSKASNKMVEFQKYNEEQEKAAKNKTADKKAELELWKAMKDVAIQEAAANHAMKNAEFGLKWQQAKMNAALQQAKANAYYGGGLGYGGMNSAMVNMYKQQQASGVGSNSALVDFTDDPDMTPKKALQKANAKAMQIPQDSRVAFIQGYLSNWNELKKGSK